MTFDVLTLPYTDTIEKMMFDSKQEDLLKVSASYNMELGQLYDILSEELKKSGMKVGACNKAIDLLIIAVLNENMDQEPLKDFLKKSILTAAIYYAIIVGKAEYV